LVASDSATHWESVALPVLQALVDKEEALRDRGLLQLGVGQDGAKWLGLDIDQGELFDTLHQLQDLGYVSFNVTLVSGPGALFLDLRLTGRGLQVLGEWPRFEAWASPATLAAFAEQLAQFVSPDDRTRLERAAAYLRSQAPGVVKGAAIAAGSQLVRSALGIP
jgi:hypothetical protein